MSHASNKVEWCIKKAEKEKETVGRHRGLITIEPNGELAQEHLQKAEDNLRVAYAMQKGGHSGWSTSAFFYCGYHCCLAIAAKFGYESRNQECTVALMEMLLEQGKINIDQNIIDALNSSKQEEVPFSLIKKREELQYGIEKEINTTDFEVLEKIAIKLLEQTKKIITPNKGSKSGEE